MSGISAWVMAIAGVCVLGVLVDLILPNGQTKKYIKGIFAFVVVLVVVSPLPSLFNKDFSLSNIFKENDAMVIQEDFIFKVNKDRIESLENMIEADLSEQGASEIKITLSANIFTDKLKIDAVCVDLSKMVISSNLEHKDISELVIKSVLKYVQIEKNSIVFC